MKTGGIRLLVLRPEPGASATAARAAAMGLDPLVAPLFTVSPLAWDPPDPIHFDALMMTSANAARNGGAGLARLARLPAFAVGDATAAAMRDAGLRVDGVGDADAAALLASLRDAGHRRVLHLCGEDRKPPDAGDMTLKAVPVYASHAHGGLDPSAAGIMREGAVALLHSPRAAALFGKLATAVDRRLIDLVAISAAAAHAAGEGWRSVSAAAAPCDADMLAIARALCQNPRR